MRLTSHTRNSAAWCGRGLLTIATRGRDRSEDLRPTQMSVGGSGEGAMHHGAPFLDGAPDLLQQQWIPHHQVLKVATSDLRSEEHTSELQSLMRISYAVF